MEEATTSPLGSGQVVYDVWLMKSLKDNKRIAEYHSLAEAYKAITPEMKREYVYILKWTPAFPKPAHIWGCLAGRVHTNDLRDQVRHILRS